MPQTDLVCLSHLRWGFVFQRPNHLISRSAKERRTFFWEEPIIDDQASPARVEIRRVEALLWIATPHLPASLSPGETQATVRALFDGFMADHQIDAPILWFYTPMALEVAGHVDATAIVYDCMDELSGFSFAPPELQERERDLFERADVVFTGGQSLFEVKRKRHANAHAFPSSVDATHFAQALSGELEEPSDQAGIPHPRIGFFGVIDERVDLDLLAQMADARPDWHIVLIGPIVKIDPDSLPKRANIHHLGQKDYAALPSYLAGWDVAMMPFALNAATRFISPTKTLEYLAAGRPIVSTAIHDVVHPYGDAGLVRIADATTFVPQIEAALEEPLAAHRVAAKAFVAGTSWDATWSAMASLVERAAAKNERRLSCSTT